FRLQILRDFRVLLVAQPAVIVHQVAAVNVVLGVDFFRCRRRRRRSRRFSVVGWFVVCAEEGAHEAQEDYEKQFFHKTAFCRAGGGQNYSKERQSTSSPSAPWKADFWRIQGVANRSRSWESGSPSLTGLHVRRAGKASCGLDRRPGYSLSRWWAARDRRGDAPDRSSAPTRRQRKRRGGCSRDRGPTYSCLPARRCETARRRYRHRARARQTARQHTDGGARYRAPVRLAPN